MKPLAQIYPPAAGPIILVASIGLILLLVLPTLSPQAGSVRNSDVSAVATQAEIRLVPRLPAESTVSQISLTIPTDQPTVWIAVEQQSDNGAWQTLSGRAETLATRSVQAWQFSSADTTAGLYRWAVYQEAGEELLSVSDPFRISTPGQPAPLLVSQVR